ncbi:hypothetical protein LTR56_013805 [Elasticomyces elasticus]|nr:hypothetical protein LTR22_027417 [Elasticomyces elasticus]KAK3637074.1 hypothetical protein LTR56_013805 [Elasticomyces elasticus]KAK4897462.1 hypothetical protein LTR49_027993 [Elasticomyces elasticus]KAK5733482.1 hypothetical protein LTS12_026938 [Elasticomyces elasticus]
MNRGSSGGRYRSRGNSSYRGGRGGRGQSNAPRAVATGLFADGIWQCECSPRLPAEHFQVKKESKNKGRWFYTCQMQEPKRCGFFLWDEDAKPRMEAAVLAGSRTEPMGRQSGGGEVQEGWDAGRAQRAARTDGMGARGGSTGGRGMFAQVGMAGSKPRDDGSDMASPTPSRVSPPPPYSLTSSSGVKRNAQQAQMDDDSDDEFFPWPLTGQEEQELAKAADTAVSVPQTPHKAQKMGVYDTPATTGKRRLPWLEQAQAPQTPATTKPAATDIDTPSKTLGAVTSIPDSIPTTITTPSPPSRYKDALSNPADSTSSLTSEALAILQPVTIPPDMRDKLRGVLSKHDLKTQGIVKGRDISRLAIKAKDAKIAELSMRIAGLENARIAELTARITSLEAEIEVDKAVIGSLRAQVKSGGTADGGVEDADSQETIA